MYIDTTIPSTPVAFEEIPSFDLQNKKISRIMLEIFEQILPNMQRLDSAARKLGEYAYTRFLENSSFESTQQKYLGALSLFGISAAAPIADGFKTVINAASASGNALVQSYITTTQASKELDRQMMSYTDADKSGVQNFLEKILSLVNQVLQTERTSG